MADTPKAWWEIVLLGFGVFGGLRAVYELASSLFFQKPKLTGRIEDLQHRVLPVDHLTDQVSSFLMAHVWIVNLNPQPTKVRDWKLEVVAEDGSHYVTVALDSSAYWKEIKTEQRPLWTQSLSLDAVFSQNISSRGCLYFPWNIGRGDARSAVLVATTARGKSYSIAWPD